MAYFPNGTSGAAYQAEYCRRCQNSDNEAAPGCYIWDLHLLHNGDPEHRDDLEALIPTQPNGIFAGECVEFVRDWSKP